MPALLIPEDYRARAVALHARELILRSPQMSAIALAAFFITPVGGDTEFVEFLHAGTGLVFEVVNQLVARYGRTVLI